jgi:hypothetical protein
MGLLSSLFFLFPAVGCVAEDDAGAEQTSTTEADVTAPADPLNEYLFGGTQTGSWNIGPLDDRFCFMSSIMGSFRGDGEHVWLSAGSGWYLNKDAKQAGVQIGARCTPRARFKPAADAQLSIPTGWTNGGSGYREVVMWSFTRSICVLTGLQGAMNSLDNRAEIFLAYPSWALDTFDARASGMCFDLGSGRTASDQGTYTWNPGGPDIRMMPISDGICAITKVQGAMRSIDDWVGLNALDGYWYLRGRGNMSVDATCYRYAN